MLKGSDSFLNSYQYFLSGQLVLEDIQQLLVKDYLNRIKQSTSDFIRLWDEGLLHVVKAEWDSRHFEIPMAKIEHIYFTDDEKMLAAYDELTTWLVVHKIKHLSVRINIENIRAINFLFRNRFELISGKVMLRYESSACTSPKFLANNILVQKMDVDLDVQLLMNIASTSFNENRFVNDDYLDKGKSQDVYVQWVRNFSSRFPSNVYIAKSDNEIAGFCFVDSNAINADHTYGLVNLIAVNKDYIRKGIAKSLLSFAIMEFQKRGVSVVHANVVNSNLSSLFLFQSVGFRVYSHLLEARKIIDDN